MTRYYHKFLKSRTEQVAQRGRIWKASAPQISHMGLKSEHIIHYNYHIIDNLKKILKPVLRKAVIFRLLQQLNQLIHSLKAFNICLLSKYFPFFVKALSWCKLFYFFTLRDILHEFNLLLDLFNQVWHFPRSVHLPRENRWHQLSHFEYPKAKATRGTTTAGLFPPPLHNIMWLINL